MATDTPESARSVRYAATEEGSGGQAWKDSLASVQAVNILHWDA